MWWQSTNRAPTGALCVLTRVIPLDLYCTLTIEAWLEINMHFDCKKIIFF